jgi:hypothetical protein
MTWAAISWLHDLRVWLEAVDSKPPATAGVAGMRATYATSKTGADCRPFRSTLAHLLGVSPVAVREADQFLEDHGWVIQTGTWGRQRTPIYRLTWPTDVSTDTRTDVSTDTRHDGCTTDARRVFGSWPLTSDDATPSTSDRREEEVRAESRPPSVAALGPEDDAEAVQLLKEHFACSASQAEDRLATLLAGREIRVSKAGYVRVYLTNLKPRTSKAKPGTGAGGPCEFCERPATVAVRFPDGGLFAEVCADHEPQARQDMAEVLREEAA